MLIEKNNYNNSYYNDTWIRRRQRQKFFLKQLALLENIGKYLHKETFLQVTLTCSKHTLLKKSQRLIKTPDTFPANCSSMLDDTHVCSWSKGCSYCPQIRERLSIIPVPFPNQNTYFNNNETPVVSNLQISKDNTLF